MIYDCDNIGILTTLTFFSMFWYGYNKFFRPNNPKIKHLMSGCVIDIPKKMQFIFPANAKSYDKIQYESCFDKWSLGHFFIYFVSGLFFPHKYLFVLLISTLCEVFEYFVGFKYRLSDLFINLLGYTIGSLLHNNGFTEYRKIFCQYHDKCLICVPILLLLLVLLYKNKNPNWT